MGDAILGQGLQRRMNGNRVRRRMAKINAALETFRNVQALSTPECGSGRRIVTRSRARNGGRDILRAVNSQPSFQSLPLNVRPSLPAVFCNGAAVNDVSKDQPGVDKSRTAPARLEGATAESVADKSGELVFFVCSCLAVTF